MFVQLLSPSPFVAMCEKNTSILFLHIPKAAGSTMNRILDRQYAESNIYSVDGNDIQNSLVSLKKMPDSEKKEKKLIRGHFHYGLHSILPNPSLYFTILRNPVERVVSHYYYVLSQKNHYLHEKVVSKAMGLETYVDSGISVELNNDQVRRIAGHQNTNDFGLNDDRLLTKAIHNIETHFAFSGIMERFDESLLIMKSKFNWKSYPFYKKYNVNPRKIRIPSISDATIEIICKYNRLDIALYKWVKKKFEKNVKANPRLIFEKNFFAFSNALYVGYGKYRTLRTLKTNDR